MQKIGWYSADDKNLSDNRLSRFEDSKFALDKKTSVVRELVQNSIDAKVGDCVYVDINVVGIERKKVPCIDELIRRIELCKKKANVDAKREYESAIELLNKPSLLAATALTRSSALLLPFTVSSEDWFSPVPTFTFLLPHAAIPSVSAIHIMATRIFLNNPFFILSAPLKILTFKVLKPKHVLIVARKILLINIRFSEIKHPISDKIAFIHKKNCRRRAFPPLQPISDCYISIIF